MSGKPEKRLVDNVDFVVHDTHKLIRRMERQGVSNETIARAFLQEVGYMIEYSASNNPQLKAALRAAVTWFSGQCGGLIQEPRIGKQEYTVRYWN
jgi:hypothetical protein